MELFIRVRYKCAFSFLWDSILIRSKTSKLPDFSVTNVRLEYRIWQYLIVGTWNIDLPNILTSPHSTPLLPVIQIVIVFWKRHLDDEKTIYGRSTQDYADNHHNSFSLYNNNNLTIDACAVVWITWRLNYAMSLHAGFHDSFSRANACGTSRLSWHWVFVISGICGSWSYRRITASNQRLLICELRTLTTALPDRVPRGTRT